MDSAKVIIREDDQDQECGLHQSSHDESGSVITSQVGSSVKDPPATAGGSDKSAPAKAGSVVKRA